MKIVRLLSATLLVCAMSITTSAQTQRMILVEQNTSSSCPNCGSQNPAFDARMLDNADKVALLKYQWGDGGHPDIMFDFNPIDVQARVSTYYSAAGFPLVWSNGTFIGPPVNYSQADIDTDAAVDAWFEIGGTATITPERDAINMTVSTAALKAFNAAEDADLVLHVAVVEKTIDYGTPPGTNSESVFHSVMRKMLPTATGEALGMQTQGQTNSFSYAYAVDTTVISIDSLQLVVFVQNSGTKAVEQAAVIPSSQEPAGIGAIEAVRPQLSVWPGISRDFVRVASADFQLMDVRGVRYNVQQLSTSNQGGSTVLDVQGLAAGHYFVLNANGAVGRFVVIN